MASTSGWFCWQLIRFDTLPLVVKFTTPWCLIKTPCCGLIPPTCNIYGDLMAKFKWISVFSEIKPLEVRNFSSISIQHSGRVSQWGDPECGSAQCVEILYDVDATAGKRKRCEIELDVWKPGLEEICWHEQKKNVCRVALKSADLYGFHISLQWIISQEQPAHMTRRYWFGCSMFSY